MHNEEQPEPSNKKSSKAIIITLVIIAAVVIGGFIFMSIMASNFKADGGDKSSHPFKGMHGL